MTQKYQVKVSMKQAAIVETGIVLKQGDFGMQIEIEVLDFDATGTTPQIVFRKAMGAVESTTITVSGNKYTYTFKGTELDTPGKCFCDLKLKNSTTQRISTASFSFKVVADTLDGLAEEASSYSDTIEQLMNKVLSTKPINSSYTDLNEFMIMGVYSLPSATVYVNDPIGAGIRKTLITITNTSNNPTGQIIFARDTGETYFRSYTNGAWNTWESEVDNKLKNALLIKEIDNSYSDINQFVNLGIYSLPTANIYEHDPIGTGARRTLITLVNTSFSPTCQIIFSRDNGEMYFRSYSNGGWNDWKSNYQDKLTELNKTINETWDANYDKFELSAEETYSAYLKPNGDIVENANWIIKKYNISEIDGLYLETTMSAVSAEATAKTSYAFYSQYATRNIGAFASAYCLKSGDSYLNTPISEAKVYLANPKDGETIIVCCGASYADNLKVYGYKRKHAEETELIEKYQNYGIRFYSSGIGTLVAEYVESGTIDINYIYITLSQANYKKVIFYDGYRFRYSEKFPTLDDLEAAFFKEYNTQKIKYGQYYPSDNIFTSGSITNGGEPESTNTRIRVRGSIAPIMYKEDYITVDPAYEVKLFGFSARTYSTATLVYCDILWKNGKISIPKIIDGKYISLVIRKIGSESVDISAEIPILHRYIKFYHEDEYNAYDRNKDKEPLIDAISRLRYAGPNKKDFTLLILSDDHGDYIAVNNAVKITNGFNAIDAMIHLGDSVASLPADYKQIHQDILLDGQKPTYYVVGNHDVGNSKAISSTITTLEAYNRFIAPLVEKGWIVEGEYTEGKPYYYHDFTDQKTRLIVVYEYDAPEDLADESNYKITRGDSVIRQDQAEWFFDTLNGTPEGFNVIIALHQPFSSNKIHITSSKFNNPAYTSDSIRRRFSTDLWADAVDAYVNRTTYTCNMVCTGDAAYLNGESGYYYSTTYDFSNAKGNFVCFIGGHTHQDSILQHTTYSYMKQIIVHCASTNDYVGGVSSMPSDIRRTAEDGLAHDSITVIGAEESAVRLAKIGANITTRMTPRDYELLSVIE